MNKTTAKNDFQGILREYFEDGIAMKVAEEVAAVILAETQHTHNGQKFFINEDENGELVLTKESIVQKSVETILRRNNLKDDVVTKCLEQLFTIETIFVEGSDSEIYSELLKYNPVNYYEMQFINNLQKAIKAGVKSFKVPVCDMSLDENGKPCFVPGHKPALNLSYNELVQIAEENGLTLGNKNQYVLFLATMIERLKANNWSQKKAIHAVCVDSRKIGFFETDEEELTGSRKIVGKCDLGNVYKILKKDKDEEGVWIAGGCCWYSNSYALADLKIFHDEDFPTKEISDVRWEDSVGWFVF